MIKKELYVQFCLGFMKPKGITIHNTNNNLSAKENYELMLNSKSSHSAHFFVDAVDEIQAIPINQSCCHTGKAFDNGNKHTIAIEICSKGNQEEWELTLNRSIKLIQRLRKDTGRNLPIYFHRDFNEKTYCPHRILNEYGNKELFFERSGL